MVKIEDVRECFTPSETLKIRQNEIENESLISSERFRIDPLEGEGRAATAMSIRGDLQSDQIRAPILQATGESHHSSVIFCIRIIGVSGN